MFPITVCPLCTNVNYALPCKMWIEYRFAFMCENKLLFDKKKVFGCFCFWQSRLVSVFSAYLRDVKL